MRLCGISISALLLLFALPPSALSQLVPTCKNQRRFWKLDRLLARAAQQQLPNDDRQGVDYSNFRKLVLAPAKSWDALDQEVEKIYDSGDVQQAIQAAKLALAAASNPKQSGRSLDRLGFLYYASGDLKQGETYLRQGLELRKKELGPESIDYAESAEDLALLCRDTGRGQEAQSLAEQAVAIQTRVLGPHDPTVAESLNRLGTVHLAQGEYESAIARLEQALAIHEAHLDPDHPAGEYGTLCANLAATYQRLGRYAKAEMLFQESMNVLRKNPGVNHPAYATDLAGFAHLEMDLGKYPAAEKLYNEAGKLLKEQLGENHPVYATFLNNRGFLYQAMGNLAAAEGDYRKSLELKKKLNGPDSPAVARTLKNLASLVCITNHAEGQKLFQEAADIFAKSSRPPPFEYASVLLGLGKAQRDSGDLNAARETLEDARHAAAEGLGPKHPLYARATAELGLVHQAAHEYAEAERQLREALAIVTETEGENHPDLARYLQPLAALYDETGDYRAAEPLYRRSFEISDKFLAAILNVGSESDKQAFLANVEDEIPMLLSFQERAGDRLPEARVLAFEAVARRKGRGLEQARDWQQELRRSADAGTRKQFDQWQALLQCQASLTIALGYRDLKPPVVGACELDDTDLKVRYARLLNDVRTKWTPDLDRQTLTALQVLRERTAALEADLSRLLPQFSGAVNPVRLEDIQSHLAPDELLIEFVACRSRRYGAFLLDSQGRLRWIPLGPAGPIDSAVHDLIQAANDWSISLTEREIQGARAAQVTAQDAIQELSKDLLTPLRPWLGKGVRRLRIAPDGMLTLIPFEALSDGRLLLDDFAISYLSAGRDLVSPPAASGQWAAPVIAVSPGAASARPTDAGVMASVFRADRLQRLEGAASEARKLQEQIPRAQLLAEGQATEQAIKQLHRPALLHIIGHGIVRGNEDCVIDPRGPGCAMAGIGPAARVMSLSAIVLEEAYGRGPGSPQDGLLTALELQTVDLSGSEMLVLSQCRMAEGVPSSGEGVYGMRRAASVAGARTFVAPLWNVSDVTQQKLMATFYKELSMGQSRADALRRAKLQLSRNPATKHFLCWAPVILAGDPAPLPKELFVR